MDPEQHGDPPRPHRVVMVDDDEHVRRLVSVALDRQPDFTVVAEATNAAAAVEAVRAHQPDVVLLDVAMLVTGSLDTLPLITQQRPTAIVVVLSGARVTSRSRGEALRLGAHGYIEASGSVSRLAPYLRELLEDGATGGS